VSEVGYYRQKRVETLKVWAQRKDAERGINASQRRKKSDKWFFIQRSNLGIHLYADRPEDAKLLSCGHQRAGYLRVPMKLLANF